MGKINETKPTREEIAAAFRTIRAAVATAHAMRLRRDSTMEGVRGVRTMRGMISLSLAQIEDYATKDVGDVHVSTKAPCEPPSMADNVNGMLHGIAKGMSGGG